MGAAEYNEEESREFLLPLHLQDLELIKHDRYFVIKVNEYEDTSMSVQWSQDLNDIKHHLIDSNHCCAITEPYYFDRVYSLAKSFSKFQDKPTMQLAMLDFLIRLLNEIVSQATIFSSKQKNDSMIKTIRTAFKMTTYILSQVLRMINTCHRQQKKEIIKSKQNKTVKSHDINWPKQVENALECLCNSLNTATVGLWMMNLPEEEFMNNYCKTAFEIFENQAMLRGRQMKPLLCELIVECVKRVPNISLTLSTSLLELVYSNEHLAVPIAELVLLLKQKHNENRAVSDIMSEIGQIKDRESPRDALGTKNISLFLSHLSSVLPALILANLSMLLPLLEANSYYLRNAVVSAIAHILLSEFISKQTTNIDSVDDEPSVEKSLVHFQSEKARDNLFNILLEREHDIHSFARSHILKMWMLLCEKGAIPLIHLADVTQCAISRLSDKSVNVRKNAISLITMLLSCNPYLGVLAKEVWVRKMTENDQNLERTKTKLIELAQAEITQGIQSVSIKEESEIIQPVEESSGDEVDVKEKEAVLEKELESLRRLALFYGSALEFINSLESQAIPVLLQLLGSSSSSDVIGSIHFFTRAHAFHIKEATAGIKKMLSLIWRSHEESIQQSVLTTLEEIFIYVPGSNKSKMQPFSQIALNLVKLISEASLAETTSLEEAFRLLRNKDQKQDQRFPDGIVKALWDIIEKNSTTKEMCQDDIACGALSILGMVAASDRSIVSSVKQLELICLFGFGERIEKEHDWITLKTAAIALSHLQPEKHGAVFQGASDLNLSQDSLNAVQKCIYRLRAFLSLEWEEDNTQSNSLSNWFSAAEQAINVIFSLCEKPELILQEILHHISSTLQPLDGKISANRLSKFVFLLGHIAIKFVVYIESLAAFVKKLKQQPKDNQNSNLPSNSMEDELGIAAEMEAEDDAFLHQLMQTEIVNRNLFGVYGPFLARLVKQLYLAQQKQILKQNENLILIESSILALCKFMCISSDFCQRNLQLLFTLLKEAKEPSTRGNIIVACGDLCFRYPNLVEPWTAHLYARLRDENLSVRKNTLMVLTHLILNDMVKVKGQVSEIAVSLVDPNERIRELARLFFNELSKKGNNPIYNMLPDTIGLLSLNNSITKGEFQEILKFLVAYINKDKQTESLVEKICQRFTRSTEVVQWRDFAFCLVNLSWNEKSFKKLLENISTYKNILHDAIVVDYFDQILSKAKKFNKLESKELIEQLDKLIKSMKVSDEEHVSDRNNGEISKPIKEKRVPSKRPKLTKRIVDSSSEEEVEEYTCVSDSDDCDIEEDST